MPPPRKYAYVVVLKNDRQKFSDPFSIFLCGFSAVVFLYAGLNPFTYRYWLLAVGVALLTGTIVNFLASRRKMAKVRYRHFLMLAAGGWLLLPNLFWMAFPFIALATLESYAKRPLEIGFDRDRIVINSLIRRRLQWSAFSNILLKDGLLTLDYKDNRLLQWEVIDDGESDADEEEFNTYCRGQLAKAGVPV
jgi:hypothetical protein